MSQLDHIKEGDHIEENNSMRRSTETQDSIKDGHAKAMELLRQPVVIRTFEDRDYPEVLECIVELQDTECALSDMKKPGKEMAEEYFASIYKPMQEEKGDIVVAECEGKVSGFIAYEIEDNDITDKPGQHIYISDLVVLQRFRGRGIATILMKQVEQVAKEKNIKRINIGVMAENQPALQLYLKQGYSPTYYSLWKEV